jgi:hypothetical protein
METLCFNNCNLLGRTIEDFTKLVELLSNHIKVLDFSDNNFSKKALECQLSTGLNLSGFKLELRVGPFSGQSYSQVSPSRNELTAEHDQNGTPRKLNFNG